MNLPAGSDPPAIVNAIIEIPKGSSSKIEYDEELDVFRLDRVLASPVHYPGAYGFIPSTLGQDGDALDIVVLTDSTIGTGCLVEVRPIGVLEMADDKGLDHKILAVPCNDPHMTEITGLQHIAPHVLKEVDYFFQIYKDLEGKFSDTYGWEDRVEAFAIIKACMARFTPEGGE
jgi:inorganic pyrophosphatase